MKESSVIADLQSKLADLRETLQRAEERVAPGLLALELMHEIRNPLEAVGNLTYLAMEEAGDSEAVRAYLRRIEEQLATLNHIANQTLGYARTASSPQQVRLATLAEAALRIHQRAVKAKQIRVIKEFSQEVIAYVYTTEMLQVMSNLIVNSLDALPRDGTLRMRLRQRNHEIHIVVADNGHGIQAQDMERIFEPYFTTKKVGNGLGLALSKKIVEHNQGRISLRSSIRAGKSGTTFKISLPA
ncbi:MAG TPA: ATP-binding protein [Acidobacteriaceae bacterium]|nr:ATP-binding protein [Acidobacteriaceae bacterium]